MVTWLGCKSSLETYLCGIFVLSLSLSLCLSLIKLRMTSSKLATSWMTSLTIPFCPWSILGPIRHNRKYGQPRLDRGDGRGVRSNQFMRSVRYHWLVNYSYEILYFIYKFSWQSCMSGKKKKILESIHPLKSTFLRQRVSDSSSSETSD